MISLTNDIEYIFQFGLIKKNKKFYVTQYEIIEERDDAFFCQTENFKPGIFGKDQLHKIYNMPDLVYIFVKADGRFAANQYVVEDLLSIFAKNSELIMDKNNQGTGEAVSG